MIFELDDDIINHIGNPDIEGAIEAISMSQNQSRHIMLASLQLLNILRNNFPNNSAIQAAVRKSISEYVYSATLKDLTQYYVKLIANGNSPRLFIQDQHRVIYLPAKLVNQSNDTWLETILIGEYITDCHFFLNIAKRYIQVNGITKYDLRFHSENGGGNTTGYIYSQKQLTNRPTICIVDSDKEFPSDINKGTAEELKIYNNRYKPLSQYIILDVHEIENLLTKDMIDVALVGDPNWVPTSATAQVIQNLQAYSPNISFFDLKLGLRRAEMRSLSTSNPKKYRYLDKALKASSSISETDTYACTRAAACTTPKNCNCYIIEPLKNRKIVKKSVENNACFSLPNPSGYANMHWDKISTFLFSWGCSYRAAL